jgi:acid stress-induced BolA-like protein IbaG/YrbA
MSHHLTTFTGNVNEAIRAAVLARLPDAVVEVSGGGGHWSLVVTSAEFAGKSMLDSHRLVMQALAPLMAGDAAPVHAVDSLITRSA